MKTPLETPWGIADNIFEHVVDKVLSVSTSSHGGILVSMDYAEAHLTEAARKRGVHFNNYLAFEEDCDCAIVLFELPALFSGKQDEQGLLASLSHWNADYLVERGISPEPTAFKRWKVRQEEEKMRAEKDPDLIVSAMGDWQTKIAGVDLVTAADGKEYLVTDSSYKKAMVDRPIRLSNCELYLKEGAA